MNVIADEIEHQEFLDECSLLVEQIMWQVSKLHRAGSIKRLWDDVEVFGDEPIFTSMLMDRMIKEQPR